MRNWERGCLILQNYGGMKLLTHLHPFPSLRMSGAVAVLSLYALMAWIETTLPFVILPIVLHGLGRSLPH